MKETLLTVSGVIKENIAAEIAAGKRPVADYVQMAEAFDADLLDYKMALDMLGKFGKVLHKIGGNNLVLAWACYRLRYRYKVIFTDGEQVGIPLAFMLKFFRHGFFNRESRMRQKSRLRSKPRAHHLMIVHILSVGKKMWFFDFFHVQTHIDVFFVYSSWQKNFIEQRWNVPPHRVAWTPFMVDANFFSPEEVEGDIRDKLELKYPNRPILCTVGLEFRDYPTLMEAVEGLDVQVVIAAASPWSKRSNSADWYDVPDNVLVQKFTQYELRQLYDVSSFVTMPLYHVDFQAGVTAILEAMAMEKAIICTSTPGQTDVVIHDQTGYYVPPEDPETWRVAIRYLLENPEEAIRMGKAGRQRILDEMSLSRYVRRLNWYVRKYAGDKTAPHKIVWELREEDDFIESLLGGDEVEKPRLWAYSDAHKNGSLVE